MQQAYLYDAIRTPFGKIGGALSGHRPDDLAAHVVRELVARSSALDPATIDESIFG
ncbi:MAG: 3-oxoadipyl-CoA thiolase, partial [Glutamicibacter protophormiae]